MQKSEVGSIQPVECTWKRKFDAESFIRMNLSWRKYRLRLYRLDYDGVHRVEELISNS